MSEETGGFGFSDEQLLAQPTVFRDGLLKDRIVLVSGGGSGLGKAIACLAGRLGATVAICGRNAERLEQTRSMFADAGLSAECHSLTVRDPDAAAALIDDLWSRHGRLDLLVNNAGGQYPQAALDFSVKGWNAVVDTNLNGTWYMMQAAARRWREQDAGGNIVNVVADVWRGMPQMAHTAAARAGVIYLSKTVAVEWAPLGIRVNCVAPGCCETSAFGRYPPEGAASFQQSNPMKHAGDAQDIAEAVIYLAASSGKFITGEVLTVDGGQQLWGDPWAAGRPPWFELDYDAARLSSDRPGRD